ncbi:PREDICTED: uncharacterized protein LOC108360207 [Rhagoletis zephyria]|uniref:uncharacterized protein LOC108360207 n=1 Tax=Rhagoletis zephyria TaxID=28612 RepID=UPI000811897E|nr:PREDICTED: uncharacterized protein LOC108360207 [Rhagoletis zephyria]
MTYWSFNIVVKPIVTYASLAWWTKATQRGASTKLSKLHRIVCIGITGAMKTCLADALSAVVGIPPFPILIEKEATTAALRILNTSDLKIGNMTGHMKVLMKFANDPILQMRDAIVPKLEISRKFEVHIADRAFWNTGNPYTKPNGEVWYTDGSKLENGKTGAAIFGPNFKKSIPMGSYPTIFQVEIHAIEIYGRECLRRGTSTKYICIMSDSQAALLALKSHKISSQLVYDCRNVLNALGDKNTVLLGWVPGHEGHDGNEEADCLAKQGAAAVFYGP